MELWIRSQDKDSLIKVEKIKLIYDYLCDEDIQLIHIETNKGVIGSYATKERALEVLDEIQKYLTPTIQMLDETLNSKQVVQINSITTFVYNMPKE